MNGCVPGLALIKRLRVTRKLAVLVHYLFRSGYESKCQFCLFHLVDEQVVIVR